jgi:hypothetical protein
MKGGKKICIYNIMIILDPDNYNFIMFEKSHLKNKKYNAILEHKETGKYKRVPFGDNRYQQFKDRTDLKLYSHLDHGDRDRRERYLARHAKTKDNKYSSSYFSAKFLW